MKSFDEFIGLVGQHLNDGWILNGAPFLAGKRGDEYVQSMYREIQEKVRINGGNVRNAKSEKLKSLGINER